MMIYNAFLHNMKLMNSAEDIINKAIRAGQYVAIELENGTTVRLDKPIKIHNIELAMENLESGKYEAYNFND